MIVETAFALILWNGHTSARGDYFSQTRMISQHTTEQECQDAFTRYGEKQQDRLEDKQRYILILSCEKVSRMTLTGLQKNPPPQTWSEWWRSH